MVGPPAIAVNRVMVAGRRAATVGAVLLGLALIAGVAWARPRPRTDTVTVTLSSGGGEQREPEPPPRPPGLCHATLAAHSENPAAMLEMAERAQAAGQPAEAALLRLCYAVRNPALPLGRAELGQAHASVGEMAAAVARDPLAREAAAQLRRVIWLWDWLAGLGRRADEELEKHPKSRDAKYRVDMANAAKVAQVAERRRWLALVAKGSPWQVKWGGDKELAAEVREFERKVRYEFALLNHAQARRLEIRGKVDEAIVEYGNAARQYEEVLAFEPGATDAYSLTLTLAELWFSAGIQCDGPRNKERDLVLIEGEVPPWPTVKVPAVKSACVSMAKSVTYYERVRDWQGPRGADYDGKPMDKTADAAWSVVATMERMLTARAAYPAGDPERVATLSVPELRPSRKQDDADIKAAELLKEVRRVAPLPIDPSAVAWLLAADAFVAGGDKYASGEDPKRAQKIALKAAELLYKTRHFDAWPAGTTARTPAEFWSARARFEAILTRYRGTKAAEDSIQHLLNSYFIENDIQQLSEVLEHNVNDSRCEWNCLPRQPSYIGAADRAHARFQHAENLEKSTDAMTDPAEVTATLARARALYLKSAEGYRVVAKDVESVARSSEAESRHLIHAVLLNVVRAYYHAQAWADCLAVLAEAEARLRAWQPTDKPDLAQRTRDLQETLEIRADLQYKFFRLGHTIADYALLYRSDPSGGKADYYLKTAAELAYFNANWDQATDLNKEIIGQLGKSSDRKQQDATRDALWQLQTIARARGDPAARLAALESFVARYQSDKTASGKVFAALGFIADIHAARGNAAAAAQAYARTLRAFADGHFAKDGGSEATAAAEAAFHLLQPRAAAFVAADPANPGRTAAAIALAAEASATVGAFAAPKWSRAAALLAARVLTSAGLTPQAIAALKHALAEPDAKALATPEVADLRLALNRLDPTYPVTREAKLLLAAAAPPLPPPYPLADNPTLTAAPPDLKTGTVALLAGKLPEAVEHLTAATTTAKGGALSMAHYQFALAHHRAGNLPAAALAAAQAARADPDHSRAVVLWSALLIRQGDAKTARLVVQAALARRPADVMLQGALSTAQAQLGDFTAALQTATAALEADPTNPEIMRIIGEIYGLMGREGLAKLALTRSWAAYHDDVDGPSATPQPKKQYDQRQHRSYGTLQGVGAEALGKEASMGHIHAMYGSFAANPGDWETARDHWQSAVQHRPDDAAAWNDLGVALIHLGDGNRALEAVTRALAVEPTLPAALANLGSAWRLTADPARAEKAKSAYLAALARDPKRAETHCNLGVLYLENRLADAATDPARYQKAADYFVACQALRAPAAPPDAAVDAFLADALRLARGAAGR